MNHTRLITAAPALIAALAVLLLAAYTGAHWLRTRHHARAQPTPHPPAAGYRQIVATALADYWTTADPARPFDVNEAADQVDTYLVGYGYNITPERTTMPTHRPRPTGPGAAALTTCLTLVCLAGGILALTREDWGWFVTAFVGACLLGYEAAQDIADHRHNRSLKSQAGQRR